MLDEDCLDSIVGVRWIRDCVCVVDAMDSWLVKGANVILGVYCR